MQKTFEIWPKIFYVHYFLIFFQLFHTINQNFVQMQRGTQQLLPLQLALQSVQTLLVFLSVQTTLSMSLID
jgi:hypothetical protein